MNIKNGLICVLIAAVLSLCTFNNVAAAPVNKLTPDIHSNHVANVRGERQQTYLTAYLGSGDATTLTIRAGQHTWLYSILSDVAPASSKSSF